MKSGKKCTCKHADSVYHVIANLYPLKYTENAIERLNYNKADCDVLRQELDIDWNVELDGENTCEMRTPLWTNLI